MSNFKEWLRVQEMGSGPYISNCADTSDYIVLGACSDQNSEKRNKDYRHGVVAHKKVNKHREKSDHS